jgi:hypothetical protein
MNESSNEQVEPNKIPFRYTPRHWTAQKLVLVWYESRLRDYLWAVQLFCERHVAGEVERDILCVGQRQQIESCELMERCVEQLSSLLFV